MKKCIWNMLSTCLCGHAIPCILPKRFIPLKKYRHICMSHCEAANVFSDVCKRQHKPTILKKWKEFDATEKNGEV